MKFKRTLSLMLSLIMLLTSLGLPSFEANAAQKSEPGHRHVHLYAQKLTETEPVTETLYSTIVSLNDAFNLFLAVDDPNKGDYDEATKTHKEPQYDMNGYTVKIYFDPYYFEYYPKADSTQPLDYTIPDTQIENSGSTSENVGGSDIITPEGVGYYPYVHKVGSAEVNGKTYTTVYATVFFGGTYLPQTDGRKWYNLCSLPLKAINTGSTDVFVENGTADTYTLELFAKDVSDEFPPVFQFDIENGGYHHIVIKDDLKPAPPVPDPVAGKYTEKQAVTLTAAPDCDIYYAINSATPDTLYTGPVDIERTSVITCYAQRREGDKKKSNTVSYTYEIVPTTPALFVDENGTKEPIQNIHSDDSAFVVYVSDNSVFGDIDDENDVYYTFGDGDAENPLYGTNPYTSWVAVTRPGEYQYIEINKNETVRLFTKNKLTGETSDISWYYLSIKPLPVSATPDQPGPHPTKIDVTLSSGTPGAKIYYTVDGTDPRHGGIEYKTPLTFYLDTTLRAVAEYGGVYSDVTSYYYLFEPTDDFGIDAFYPSGTYMGSVDVTLMPANPDNTVKYTINGNGPYTFDDVITIDDDSTIVAWAIDKNGNEGEEYTFTYEINPQPPEFAPESTQFSNSDKITIYTPESNRDTTDKFKLYYTTDGSDPITNGILANDELDMVEIEITDYTVVSAVVLKNDKKYSTVVTHSYDIVLTKPVKPLTTLVAGHYTLATDAKEGYTTQFVPVPDGTEIYYTITTGGTICPDPAVGDGVTKKYEGEEIDIKGETIIKAVAINEFGVKSDIGIFNYTITPEAPKAAPSATINSDRLPVVEVEAVPGSTLEYTLNGFVNTFTVPANGKFYIDTQTKNAYTDEACQTPPLGNVSMTENTSPANLTLSSTLDGVKSPENNYSYILTDDESVLAPPYANKKTGQYDEIDIDGNNNLLLVKLNSLNSGDTIEYRLDNTSTWEEYTRGSDIEIGGDTILQVRSKKGSYYSDVRSYVYTFVPLAPIITLPSGRYASKPIPRTSIEIDPNAPDFNYTIYYRANGNSTDFPYRGQEYGIEYTMAFRAYVYNEDTGKTSPVKIHYYIIEPDNSFGGSVRIRYPYEDTRISAHLLSTSPYNQGIKLYTLTPNVKIRYYYEYSTTNGDKYRTENIIYDDAMPIFVNASMDNITINACLVDATGKKIEGSDSIFPIDFLHLSIPTTSLGNSGEFPKNTNYTIIDGSNDENVSIYYTLDGSDPTNPDNASRKLYGGETLILDKTTTVKAVYHSACGKCAQCLEGDKLACSNAEYGEVGSYRYTVPTVVSSGGGGGGYVDHTRKYTVDIFGYEHPTHIGYINGYPDGSVKPEGNITREEIAAILYRIKNKEYDEPFTSTGEVFPDVEYSRWSRHEIEYMTNDGVIIGYPDSEFKPTRNLTRAEFAALISRFANLKNTKNINAFPDVEETYWAYDNILALDEAGLLEGYEDGTFRPERQITRAEVMTVINKLLGRKPHDPYVKSLNVNPYNDLDIQKWYYVIVLEATITHNYYLNSAQTFEVKWEDIK